MNKYENINIHKYHLLKVGSGFLLSLLIIVSISIYAQVWINSLQEFIFGYPNSIVLPLWSSFVPLLFFLFLGSTFVLVGRGFNIFPSHWEYSKNSVITTITFFLISGLLLLGSFASYISVSPESISIRSPRTSFFKKVILFSDISQVNVIPVISHVARGNSRGNYDELRTRLQFVTESTNLSLNDDGVNFLRNVINPVSKKYLSVIDLLITKKVPVYYFPLDQSIVGKYTYTSAEANFLEDLSLRFK